MKLPSKVAFMTGVMRYRHWGGIGAALILGAIFVIAGTGKMPEQSDAYIILFNISEITLFSILADYIHIWLPAIELTVGILLMLGVAARVVGGLSITLIGAFIFNNIWMINENLAEEACYCFGQLSNSLLGFISTRQALYIDIGMLALVVIILLLYPGKWLTLRPWFLRNKNVY